MQLTRTRAPAPIVSLVDALVHLRVSHDSENDLIGGLIEAASDHIAGPSGVLGQCLGDQEWLVELPGWADPLVLPVQPVRAVVSVRYVDQAGVLQVLDPAAYRLVTPWAGRPELRPATAWPALGAATYPVELRLTCGAEPVPAAARAAALMIVSHFYDHREGGDGLPPAVHALLAPLRRGLVG